MKQRITQSEFYSLPEVVKANEVLKRTPRGQADNVAAFKRIVKVMDKYEVPSKSKWTMADY